jgi:Tfp pilus assembly pilus retraction ATPase PilT
MPTIEWERLMETCITNNGSDVILRSGSPPFLRGKTGLQAMRIPPVSVSDLAAMVAGLLPSHDLRPNEYGYRGLDVPYGDEVFRAAVFGDPNPSLVLLMRMPKPAARFAGAVVQ